MSQLLELLFCPTHGLMTNNAAIGAALMSLPVISAIIACIRRGVHKWHVKRTSRRIVC